MKPILAALCAVAALAACSTYDPNYTANPPNPDPLPLAQGAIIVPAGSVAVPSGTVAAAPAGTVVVPAAPATAVAVAPTAVRFDAGNGTVTSVSRIAAVAPSASAGASVAGRDVYRLGLRMDDGTTQTLDQDSSAFRVGDRVEVTRDAHIIRRR